MSIQIRELIEQDYELVLGLARELASWFNPLDQMALAIDLLRHKGLVATEAQQIVGFVTYYLPERQTAELSWFGVERGKQRQGIGARLLAALESVLLKKGVITLEVSTVPSDHDSIFTATNAFYRRSGFGIKQRDQDYYAYGRPRVLLEKQLNKAIILPIGLGKTESGITIKPSLQQ